MGYENNDYLDNIISSLNPPVADTMAVIVNTELFRPELT